jgi:hypothetical protein
MPQTTEFENTDMIPKVVAMLNVSSAKEISRI